MPNSLAAQQDFLGQFLRFQHIPFYVRRELGLTALFQVSKITVLCDLAQPHPYVAVAAEAVNAPQRTGEVRDNRKFIAEI